MSGVDTCERCGRFHRLDDLDAKPQMTLWLFIIWALFGQLRMLRYAADHGYAFDRLECAHCYGPGYERGGR